MASRAPLAVILSLSFFVSSALGGDVICEELSPELCAFAVSTSGNRCVVESYRQEGETKTAYHCRTSVVMVERIVDWVESDGCVAACGADRRMVGISSDALLDPIFTEKLCSPECYGRCPNIVDLYDNLAAGEGVVLPHLCETRRTNPSRAMSELQSSGDAAVAPAAVILTTEDVSAPSAGTSDGPISSISDAAALSDVSEFSIDAASDELDADPVPVPAESPAFFSDIEDEEEDADFI